MRSQVQPNARRGAGTLRRRGTAGRGLLLAAFVGCISALALTQTASAQSASELGSKADSARERAQALAREIAQQRDQLSAQQTEAADAAAQGAALDQRLRVGRERIAELGAELQRAEAELGQAQRRLRRSSAALAERLVAIYKDGQPDELDLLLSSDGYDQFGARAEYLRRIKAADDALIDQARSRRAAVSEQVAAVASARDRRQALNAELSAASAEIAAVRAAAEQRAAAIGEARRSSQADLGAVRSQADRLERRAQEAERSSAQATAPPAYGAPKNGWAIPEEIVMCESGGNWHALNPISGAGGAYQILPSTWKLYGGKGLPHQASPAEQNRIAAMIWADSGPSAWECAS